ncbi:HD domain-containing protein, partial [Photobacterium kishitanii]
MILKNTLKERSLDEKSNDHLHVRDLLKIIDDIEHFAEGHLKRVFQILSEFDVHDISHSKKVIDNIEELLGDEVINSLSSYELFFLQTSALLHDCAMAPAEWEIYLMKMTEGTDNFYESSSSIKRDLKSPYSYQEALIFINELWNELKVNLTWFFCPMSESDLKKELALLLIGYQEYRNGYKFQIDNITTHENFKLLSKEIRINFIRENHHLRIESYIKNLAHKFGDTLNQSSWGKKIASDLACICRAHGEDLDFLYNLETESNYLISGTTNLQFVAMMLRLGDIIHYSYDRAPLSISKGKVFESYYSFHEWAVKENGVNYDIKNGTISFKAYCSKPNDYFKLHKYIDYIDQEIQNYFILNRQWDNKYSIKLTDKVVRTGIRNDEEEFLPITGLNFKINQKQIIELLMGVGLYKDKYACLREIYQNSMDACRASQSALHNSNPNKKYRIEFSLETRDSNVYLCCHDNGIGMNRSIIEGYLLNIGNSYYKSSYFYREQAKWSGMFTPTSQFGIGILSCFMIGNRIDISTKKANDKLICCSVEGPHESFYYRKDDILDKELIGDSGTIIRILLSDDVAAELCNHSVDDFVLNDIITKKASYTYVDKEKYNKYYIMSKRWSNHLYTKINSFIGSTFDDISVYVKYDNGKSDIIKNKPYVLDYKKLKLEEHTEYLDLLNKRGFYFSEEYKYSEIVDSIEYYEVNLFHEGTKFTTFISLPI